MPAITLTTAERKDHRASAHHLNPVVMIGGDGLTPAVIAETDAALKAHGLIKIRVFSDERQAREDMLATLVDHLDAAPIQHIGKLLVLWRPKPEPEAAVASREGHGGGMRLVKVVQAAKMEGRRPVVKMVKLMGNQRVTPGGQIKRVKKRAISVKKRVG